MNFLEDEGVKKKVELVRKRCRHLKIDGICCRDSSVCGELFNEGCNFDLFLELSETYPTIEQILNRIGIPTIEQELNGVIKQIYAHTELKQQEQLVSLIESQANLFQSEGWIVFKGEIEDE